MLSEVVTFIYRCYLQAGRSVYIKILEGLECERILYHIEKIKIKNQQKSLKMYFYTIFCCHREPDMTKKGSFAGKQKIEA